MNDMKEAYLYSKLDDGSVVCDTCCRHCPIKKGNTGFCRMYKNIDGTLFSISYGIVSSYAMDPIEKKPVYHYHPATQIFSIGGYGCNFHCGGCQNYSIACVDEAEHSDNYEPEDIITIASQWGSEGIAFTYNEPTVNFDFNYDVAKLAREKGLYTVFVTNGFMSSSALKMISPYLDVFRVDIKGFSEDAYSRIANIKRYGYILQNAIAAKKTYGMHVEVVTNITPDINDKANDLIALSEWIAANLGKDTPWHVTRFFPRYLMSGNKMTSLDKIKQTVDIGHGSGLKYVYAGNLDDPYASDTRCPECGNILISRNGYNTRIVGYEDGVCKQCHAEVDIK